jgi:hypothetical protein
MEHRAFRWSRAKKKRMAAETAAMREAGRSAGTDATGHSINIRPS